MPNLYETAVNHVTEGDVKDEFVMIETSERTVITALESKPDRFEIVRDDRTAGCPRMVTFRIPVADVNWAGLAKRRGSARPHLRNARQVMREHAESPSAKGTTDTRAAARG